MLSRELLARRYQLKVVRRNRKLFKYGLGERGLDAQHGLAAVGEAVLTAGRQKGELAWRFAALNPG